MKIIDSALRFLKLSIIGTSLLALPLAATADWKLITEESDFAFATIKNSAVAEAHTFERFSGVVTKTGDAMVQVDLASVETQIPIRNERMGTMLFNIGRFPQLSVSSNLDTAMMVKMEEGASVRVDLPAKVTLHGTHADMLLPLVVTRLSAKRFQVVTTKPVIAYASQFGLTEGVEALRVIANLTSIAPAVPVTFSLIFEQDS